MLMYDESRQLAVGERCMLDNPPRDSTGRIIDPDCRNINAGTFHLAVTNIIGLMGRPIGEDRVSTRQVWNQPISSYRITKQQELSLSSALARLNLPSASGYAYNPDASRFVEVEMELDYITESHPSTTPMESVIRDYVRTDVYRYILELDEVGDVIGGEWLMDDDTDVGTSRPDYLWIALGPGLMPTQLVDAQNIRYLHRLSRPETRQKRVFSRKSVVNERIKDWPGAGTQNTISVAESQAVAKVTVHFSVVHDFAFDVSVRLIRDGQEYVLLIGNPEAVIPPLWTRWLSRS